MIKIHNKFIVIGSVVILLIAIFFGIRFLQNGVIENTKQLATSSSNQVGFTPLVIGNPNAAITIVEYADYKCPECGKFHQNAGKQIRKDYIDTGKAKIVFRPFPVFSEEGAKALAGSYCANAQGKFVQYHDRLFEYMWENHFKKGDYQKALDPVLTDSVIGGLLNELGIDKFKYDTCLTDEKTLAAYNDDVGLAAPDEINGTPSFVIGGQKIVGPQPYSVFKTLLDIQSR